MNTHILSIIVLFFFSTINAVASSFSCLGNPLSMNLLPKCEESDGLVFNSNDHPTRTVMMTCPRRNKQCFDAAKTIALQGNGAEVIILQVDEKNQSIQFEQLDEKLSQLTLPGRGYFSSSPKFSRDVGIFANQGGVPTFLHLPYIEKSLGATSSTVFEEVSRFCGFKNVRSYATLQEVLEKVSSLRTEEKFKDQSDYALRQETDVFFSLRAFAKKEEVPGSMGGNFLKIPGSALLVGHSRRSQLSSLVRKKFEEQSKIVEIELPSNLSVGHIDEVFNILPSISAYKGQCPFTMLVASPQEPLVLAKKLQIINDTDVQTAQANELLIEESLSHIKHIIKKDLNCEPNVVRLPTFFALQKYNYKFNPINGLYVNGTYFFAHPLFFMNENNPSAYFIEQVQNRLQKIGINSMPLKTAYLDMFGGSIHCGTLEIRSHCR